uniref:Uncharacterized protein n=1 Tax=Romanomermis culicivorax TaxID=13658 RepID=A0A915L5L6_ROMCU
LHHILPNRTLKIIGRHDEPIEELALSKVSTENEQFLVSCGHDSKVVDDISWLITNISTLPRTDRGDKEL